MVDNSASDVKLIVDFTIKDNAKTYLTVYTAASNASIQQAYYLNIVSFICSYCQCIPYTRYIDLSFKNRLET